MAQFDTIIKGGTVVDGTRVPRYKADIGIKNGKIAKIGHLNSSDANQGARCERARLSPRGSSICTATMMRSSTGIRSARSAVGTA